MCVAREAHGCLWRKLHPLPLPYVVSRPPCASSHASAARSCSGNGSSTIARTAAGSRFSTRKRTKRLSENSVSTNMMPSPRWARIGRRREMVGDGIRWLSELFYSVLTPDPGLRNGG